LSPHAPLPEVLPIFALRIRRVGDLLTDDRDARIPAHTHGRGKTDTHAEKVRINRPWSDLSNKVVAWSSM
jgi:hypothetical protein